MAKKAAKKTKLDELWEKLERVRIKFDEAKAAEIMTYNIWQKAKDKLTAASDELNKALKELREHEKKLHQKEEP